MLRSQLAGLLLVLPLLPWAGLALALDLFAPTDPVADAYDAVIVAGCRVMPTGEPSSCLAARTRRAVELWQEGLAPVVIFTGGVGSFPPSEAEAAARYARSLGLPEAAIRKEDRSTSTEENARLAALELEMREPVAQDAAQRRVLVVTDRYHSFRARRVFDRHFPEVDAVGVVSEPWPRLRGALREVPAIGWYLLCGRL